MQKPIHTETNGHQVNGHQRRRPNLQPQQYPVPAQMPQQMDFQQFLPPAVQQAIAMAAMTLQALPVIIQLEMDNPTHFVNTVADGMDDISNCSHGLEEVDQDWSLEI